MARLLSHGDDSALSGKSASFVESCSEIRQVFFFSRRLMVRGAFPYDMHSIRPVREYSKHHRCDRHGAVNSACAMRNGLIVKSGSHGGGEFSAAS